jgi:hypothetical protein
MTRLVLAILLILSFNSSIIAQQFTPPKKASKIIVNLMDTSNILDKIALELFDRRFTIDSRDNNLKYLVTKERTNSNGMMLTKIRAIIKDSSLILTSEMAFANDITIMGVTTRQTFDPVTYSGMKKSYMMQAWNELDSIARKFGTNVTYSK